MYVCCKLMKPPDSFETATHPSTACNDSPFRRIKFDRLWKIGAQRCCNCVSSNIRSTDRCNYITRGTLLEICCFTFGSNSLHFEIQLILWIEIWLIDGGSVWKGLLRRRAQRGQRFGNTCRLPRQREVFSGRVLMQFRLYSSRVKKREFVPSKEFVARETLTRAMYHVP